MKRLKRPSPSMTVALVALFVALGGTATAAKLLITHTSQIKNGAIARADIAQSAINGARVKDRSLSIGDLNGEARKQIESGPDALETMRGGGPTDVPAGENRTVATMRNIPPGTYALFAKSVLTSPSQDNGILDPGGSIGARCTLIAEGDNDESRTMIGTPGANSPGGVNMQMVHTFGKEGEAELECQVSNAPWSASSTSIIAILVGAPPQQNVEG